MSNPVEAPAGACGGRERGAATRPDPPLAAAAAARQGAEPNGAVYVVLHIPKTAGQTIQEHFAAHCPPGVFWRSQHKLPRGRPREPGDLPDFERARIVSGHQIARSLERYFPGRELRRVVLLRDPLELQLSYYNWKMMDHLAKGLGTYGFDLHLRALPRNFIAHFLLSRWLEIPSLRLAAMPERQKYALLNETLAGFWFVGGHRHCDSIIAEIGRDLGVPRTARRRNTAAELQAHTGWRLLTIDSLSPAERGAFRSRNALDQALWESWRDAGFAAPNVQPGGFAASRRKAALGDELARPWFRLRRFAAREFAGSRRPAAVLIERANRARDAAEWALAASRYREALQAVPRAPAIWVQYGHALKEWGRVGDAEDAYRRALALQPDAADTHLQLGHALKLQRRLGEAEAAYRRALALDPGYRHARDELAALGWPAGRIADAAGTGERGGAGASDSG